MQHYPLKMLHLVFERALYKTTTEGSIHTEESISGGYKAVLLGAFSANVRNLLADPIFVRLLLKDGEPDKDIQAKPAPRNDI
jgi:hypothetical protein